MFKQKTDKNIRKKYKKTSVSVPMMICEICKERKTKYSFKNDKNKIFYICRPCYSGIPYLEFKKHVEEE